MVSPESLHSNHRSGIVDILRSLDHPNIVRAIETFDYQNHLSLVLELCSGGDLYSRDPYTEDQAKVIVRSLLSAVAYLHSHNIVHRDLKFENVVRSLEPSFQAYWIKKE
jgi:calcium-dependent protein kinase